MPRKTRTNSITSPELLKQVNPENMQLLDDFIQYLRSVDRSETTIEAYRSDLHICFVWNLQHNNNKFFVDWTKRNVMAFQNWLINDNGNSPARVRRMKASLSSMSQFIERVLDDEYPNFRNIINRIEAPPKRFVREKTVLTEEDVQSMLDLMVEKGRYDIACCVALAAYGGRRKRELCLFRVDDFSDDRLICGGSLYKSSPMRTKGRGRAGKVVCCYTLAHKFKPYFDMWMKDREEKGVESEWLFPTQSDSSKHINHTTITSWMTVLCKATGKDIYAHSFRHRFTTMLSEEGIPDNVIKEIQHWESLDLVSVYCDTSTEETLEQYFGTDGIKSVEKKGLSDL